MGWSLLKKSLSRLPELIPGPQIDELTGGLLRWRTIKNLRCKKKIPEECFCRITPRKVLIVRDAFIAWLESYGQGSYSL